MTEHKIKFAILITGHNTEKWIGRCLLSALSQDYEDFRVVLVDDASTDWTPTIVESFKVWARHGGRFKANLRLVTVSNEKRRGALANYAGMMHLCSDDEVVVMLDGDDQLADDQVLNRLAREYADPDVWMTYGSFAYDLESRQPNGDYMGICAQLPPDDHTRKTSWCASHLRTFYAWLFKKIDPKDLLYEGKYYKVAWDLPLMCPMLEMAGPKHARFIPDVLYLYNLVNLINDCRVYSQEEIQKVVNHVKALPIYPLIGER